MKRGVQTFHYITLFPNLIEPYFAEALLHRAEKAKLIKKHTIQLRDFADDERGTVDGVPYGGGPGMVLKPEPIYKAVTALKKKIKGKKMRVILFSTRGKKFTNEDAKRLSKYEHVIFICGRYEGVDERVAEHVADEEISLGDFVLAGGELPALLVTEAVTRQIPGTLGKHESLEEIKGSYPTYTRPPVFRKWKVPEVLQEGNHKKIEEWREKEGKRGKNFDK